MLHVKIIKRVNPKSSHHRKNILLMSLILLLRMDAYKIYCYNHFIIDVSQIIMLYTLNLSTAAVNYISIKMEKSK